MWSRVERTKLTDNPKTISVNKEKKIGIVGVLRALFVPVESRGHYRKKLLHYIKRN